MSLCLAGPHLVVHAYQLHLGEAGSHLALKSTPSAVPHLIAMATSPWQHPWVYIFCEV